MMEVPSAVLTSSIGRGDILLTEFDGIEHQKFFVIMGVSESGICGFFFINSNIHPIIFRKQELLEMQYPLLKSDYHFLKYDSFLCTSTVMEKSVSSITEGIKDGSIKVISHLKDKHINEVLDIVLASKAISERHKKLYFR